MFNYLWKSRPPELQPVRPEDYRKAARVMSMHCAGWNGGCPKNLGGRFRGEPLCEHARGLETTRGLWERFRHLLGV